MSDMFRIIVVNRGESWVDLGLQQTHPDATSVSEDRGFALMLLLDCDEDGTSSLRGLVGKLGDRVDTDELDRRAGDLIRSVRVYRAVNVPYDEQRRKAACAESVLERGVARGSAEWSAAYDDAWQAWATRADGYPRATLRIEVSDPRHLAHIEMGKEIDSAAWAWNGPHIAEPRAEKLGVPADAVLDEVRAEFPLSHVARRTRSVDRETIELGGSKQRMSQAALEEALAEHLAFLASGGRDGSWEVVDAEGLPVGVYSVPQSRKGEQLMLTLRGAVEGASLVGRDLAYANISGSVCRRVSFVRAKLDGSLAVDSFFEGSKFDHASMRGVDFSGSVLKSASFRGADLRGADFAHTDCSHADFTGAILDGARFPGAILDDVRR